MNPVEYFQTVGKALLAEVDTKVAEINERYETAEQNWVKECRKIYDALKMSRVCRGRYTKGYPQFAVEMLDSGRMYFHVMRGPMVYGSSFRIYKHDETDDYVMTNRYGNNIVLTEDEFNYAIRFVVFSKATTDVQQQLRRTLDAYTRIRDNIVAATDYSQFPEPAKLPELP
jgi:hypothetical protein